MYDSSSTVMAPERRVARTVSHEHYSGALIMVGTLVLAYAATGGKRVLLYAGNYGTASQYLESWLEGRQLAVSRLNALRTMAKGYCIIGRIPSGRSRSYVRRYSFGDAR